MKKGNELVKSNNVNLLLNLLFETNDKAILETLAIRLKIEKWYNESCICAKEASHKTCSKFIALAKITLSKNDVEEAIKFINKLK